MAGYINPVSFTTPSQASPQALAQGLMPLSEVANQPGQFSAAQSPSISPDALLKMAQMSQPKAETVKPGSGLTGDFAQGIMNPNSSTATGAGLSSEFKNALYGVSPTSLFAKGFFNG
jgi:hypothetical protein